jgi:hypothetical protein
VKEIDNSPPPPDWKRVEEDNPNLIPLVTTRGCRRVAVNVRRTRG